LSPSKKLYGTIFNAL